LDAKQVIDFEGGGNPEEVMEDAAVFQHTVKLNKFESLVI
jgi:hypothetical protein